MVTDLRPPHDTSLEDRLKDSRCRGPGVPPSIYYVPNFLSAEEHDDLVYQIDSQPARRWTVLTNRRLMNVGGIPHEKGMMEQPIPHWLARYHGRLSPIFDRMPQSRALFNHVLINEYNEGQGIMAHKDGPIYVPVVVIISLLSPVCIHFRREEREEHSTACTLILEPRSMLVFCDDVYQDYLHHIEEAHEEDLNKYARIVNWDMLGDQEPFVVRDGDTGEVVRRAIIARERRISLTMRIVKKTINKKLFRF